MDSENSETSRKRVAADSSSENCSPMLQDSLLCGTSVSADKNSVSERPVAELGPIYYAQELDCENMPSENSELLQNLEYAGNLNENRSPRLSNSLLIHDSEPVDKETAPEHPDNELRPINLAEGSDCENVPSENSKLLERAGNCYEDRNPRLENSVLLEDSQSIDEDNDSALELGPINHACGSDCKKVPSENSKLLASLEHAENWTENRSRTRPDDSAFECEDFSPGDDVTVCGLGPFRPQWLQRWATPKAYLVAFSLVGIVNGAYYNYLVATMSTLEKRYAFRTKLSGTLMLADEIVPLFLGVLGGYLAGRMHRPRIFAAGMFLSAACCFVSALPFVVYGSAKNLRVTQ